MEYRRLGHSGLIIRVLVLGSMQFGQGMNMGNLDQAEDPRPKVLEPSRFAGAGPWRDLRGRKR